MKSFSHVLADLLDAAYETFFSLCTLMEVEIKREEFGKKNRGKQTKTELKKQNKKLKFINEKEESQVEQTMN